MPSLGAAATPVIGMDAGWLLSFEREEPDGSLDKSFDAVEFSCEDYYGDLRATLPSGLEGGTYSFVVEGITDGDYTQLSMTDQRPIRVTLYLYWRDAVSSGAGGALKNYGAKLLGVGGLSAKKSADLPASARVSVLRATSVERRAGSRRYELRVAARELIFDRASASLIGSGNTADTFDQLVTAVATGAHLGPDDYQFYAPKTAPAAIPPVGAASTVAAALGALAAKLEDAANAYGRGMLLIRTGKLHIGQRPIPLAGDGSAPVTVDESAGLLEITTLRRVAIDPNFDRTKNPGVNPPTRRQFRLLCKGRPDLHPGDVISFTPPDEDAASTAPPFGGGIAGAIAAVVASAAGIAGSPVGMYIESVDHKLSRSDAFVTTITGVELPAAVPNWDTHTVVNPGVPRVNERASSATAEASVIDAARRAIDRALTAKRFGDVAEVRAVQNFDTTVAPAQSLKIWEGLTAPPGTADGGSRQAARLDVARPGSAPALGIPYLTPFAWGPCGLILPQYPGSRVFVEHRNGQADDPVAIGSLWQNGHAPANAKAGDFWLILPVNPANPASLDDANTNVPDEYAGNAVNDLTDIAGSRRIEATTFSVQAGDLKKVGTRPADVPAGTALQIVQQNGSATATITLKTDGSISVSSSKGITFDAQDDISITSAKKINIKAAAVNVTVQSTMDVSQG